MPIRAVLLLALLLLAFLSACSSSSSSSTASKPSDAPTTTEPAKATPAARGSELDPSRVCMHSACGQVTDEAGKPVAGAWLMVVRSDDVVDEKSTLGADGRWVLHMREENSGPRPWKLKFGAPGHEAQTIDVPDPLPGDGFEIAIKLKANP